MRSSLQRLVVLSVSLGLAACAASPGRFYKDRYSLGDTRLCRTAAKADKGTDAGFADDVRAEEARRGLSPERCHQLEVRQAIAIGAAAVVATAIVVATHDHRHGGGGGGGGAVYVDTPVYAPVYVPAYDTEWDWDQFQRGGQLVWECRGVQTGRFAAPVNCAGLPMTDWRWPDK